MLGTWCYKLIVAERENVEWEWYAFQYGQWNVSLQFCTCGTANCSYVQLKMLIKTVHIADSLTFSGEFSTFMFRPQIEWIHCNLVGHCTEKNIEMTNFFCCTNKILVLTKCFVKQKTITSSFVGSTNRFVGKTKNLLEQQKNFCSISTIRLANTIIIFPRVM